MTVLIVTGGNTSERPISLISARQVKIALEQNRHKTKLFDLKNGFEILRQLALKFDTIFPVLHGKDGEDGKLYRFLKTLNKPFVGNDCNGTEVAFNKILFKKFCEQNNIPTANWMEVKNREEIYKFGIPSVLKGAEGGSSREVLPIKCEHDLRDKRVEKLLNLNSRVFSENYLEGIEVTVGVLHNKALPVVEIIPPQNGWFDYKNKYSGESKELIDAPSLDSKTKRLIQNIALKIHRQLELGPYSRTDIIVSNNLPYVLEVNSPCGVGLTPTSLFPKAAKAAGISFNELVEKLVQ